MPTSMMQVSQPVTHSLGGQTIKQAPELKSVKKSGGINIEIVERSICKPEELGIEVVEKIVWQGWEPGREYTKNIVLKNVKVKTQKIKYNVPSTRFFTTLYPKQIVLSAGTSFSLPVTFRPLEKSVYDDKITFHTKEGTFEIPIKAVLPKYDIEVPTRVSFDMCAAKDFIEATFVVANSGDLETELEWQVGQPFTIEPEVTKLGPRESKMFKATFKPDSATGYEAVAVCKYGQEGELSKTTTLVGIGKYPHIIVSSVGKPSTTLNKATLEAVIEFGPTAVGTTVQKMVELHNLSPVRAPYKVEHPSALSRIDTVFTCPKMQGIVPPMSSVKIPISYSPNMVDVVSVDYFNVIAIGKISKSVIKCVGSSKGPEVQLGARIVNFLQIDVGDVATRTIDLINNSDIDAEYQFMIDCNESVFKFEQTAGTLKAHEKRTLILKFIPQHPINYYRRVACVIHNKGPLFLDLLGTCHSELVKPAVLQSKHLDNYRTHIERGFSVFPPEQLNELRQQGRLELDDAGALMAPVIGTVENPAEHPLHQFAPMDEYFNDGFHSEVINFVPHVSLDVNVLDFGNCQNLRVIEDKILNLTNHTKGKVTVQWIGGPEKTFSVTPEVIDIPPLKSCAFQVKFKPNAPNQFFGCELECYVFYKSLRDYKLVESTTHCPPWCITLSCTGHTFMPNNETFLPKYTMDSDNLVFPAVNAKESTYRTILMTNTGTTPILFDVEKDPSKIFSIKPAKALMKGQRQIYVVKISPSEVKTYKHKMKMRLNDNNKYDKELKLVGSAEAPLVLLDTQGEMFFKPTCIGTSSKRTYSIKNVSRIPLRYEWKMRFADKNLLSVYPESGIIQPNESQSQLWSFVPKQEQKYLMKPALVVWGQGFSSTSSGGKKKQFDVRAVGEGSIGDIKAEEGYIDFSDVIVGSSASKHITLFNNSICSLHYRLSIDQTLDGPYPDEMTRSDMIGLELDRMEGIIPARSRQVISAMVRPVRRVTYQFAISYQLVTPEDKDSVSTQEPQHLCHILATGVFPTMSITDARCFGSAVGISKKQLWSLFSLDSLNVCLDNDPSARELMYSVQTRHSHQRRPPVYTRAIMDFNFSAAPLGSEPCIVSLMFENTGTVATEWAFLFPSDLHMELEYWAETGEFDEDELHEMKVMDNNLFTIEPKKGQLQPGECGTVTFQYRHTMAGTDRLPVLLKLARGREILLNFIGVTVEPERRYIHFPSSKHMFTPVPVGEKISPKQVYELYNGGAVPVRYQFDLTPMELIKQENFDQPIFECLNPVGEIPPGRTLNIEWRFSPIEAKTYMVDVPIHVHNGDTAIVTFTGVGYDKRIMGDTMPLTDQQDLTGVPGVQSVPVPGQLAFLSQERLSFGNLPLFCRGRRMVFITNRSKTRPVSFEWHVTCPSDSQYLSIAPVRGYLNPGEGKMCRVIFIACGQPSFYDLDLVCEVTDQVEYGNYQNRLKEWDDERLRQKYEFTITEDDLDADKRVGSPEITDRPLSRLKTMEECRRSTESADLARYRTLPPISKLSPDEEKQEGERVRRKEDVLWEKPEPPTPFLLHLGLTARTHDIRAFQTNFADDYKKFYVDRCLSEREAQMDQSTQSAPAHQHETKRPDLIPCLQSESDVIGSVMANVLRGLLDDTSFHSSVLKVMKDPIPIFAQIGERRILDAPQESGSPPGSPVEMTTDMVTEETSERATSLPATPTSVSSTASSKKKTKSKTGSVSSGRSKTSGTGASKTSTPRFSKAEVMKVKQEEEQLKQKQDLKKLPEFGNAVEGIIENTLLNVLSEALEGEFNITSRPRFIALPKRNGTGSSKGLKS
ncbi:cilia- and flagella-associated protein 65-like isoform X2 [Ruditapes philippinarum]|uniref:cilia- and flagella-associated protein 65-like isoform X2 n=1 Tax=Ruditapes philippinarum TaxID=129788 RepID=UPI00295C1134|nr:cilia- and flagella-associated protein 65-like isoform X2 [Ruditapes philippinarum]